VQHALSPANALDTVSIAAATKTVVVILIMVNAQTEIALLRSIFTSGKYNWRELITRLRQKATCPPHSNLSDPLNWLKYARRASESQTQLCAHHLFASNSDQSF